MSQSEGFIEKAINIFQSTISSITDRDIDRIDVIYDGIKASELAKSRDYLRKVGDVIMRWSIPEGLFVADNPYASTTCAFLPSRRELHRRQKRDLPYRIPDTTNVIVWPSYMHNSAKRDTIDTTLRFVQKYGQLYCVEAGKYDPNTGNEIFTDRLCLNETGPPLTHTTPEFNDEVPKPHTLRTMLGRVSILDFATKSQIEVPQ